MVGYINLMIAFLNFAFAMYYAFKNKYSEATFYLLIAIWCLETWEGGI